MSEPLARSAAPADAAFLARSLIEISRSMRERPGSPYNALLPDAVTPREFAYALSFVNRPERLALVWEEGEAVACLLAEIAESSVPTLVPGKVGIVAACWVAPAFRRRGIARELVAQAEAWFRAQGAAFAELSYGAASETAGEAWAKLGYAPFRVLAGKNL